MLNTFLGGKNFRNHRVSRFMVSGDLFVFIRNDPRRLLHAHDDLVEGVLNILHGYLLITASCCDNSTLIKDIFEFCRGKTGGVTCYCLQIYVIRKGFVAGMNLKNKLSCTHVGKVYCDLLIKTTGAEECTVQNVRAVCCSHDYYAFVFFKTVHLHQELVQRLLSFVMSAAEACAALSAHGIDFVYEYDTGSIFLCLFEGITDSGCTYTDVKFNKV